MGGVHHHFSVGNTTRAAMAWAATPVGLLVRVQVLVTVCCVLLSTHVFLGYGRRRRTIINPSIRAVVWFVLTMSYPAVSYTIGQMQSGSFRNELVVVWACFLLGCTAISASTVDGPDQQIRTFLNQAAQVCYVLLLLLSYIGSLQLRMKILLPLLWLLNVAKLGLLLQNLLKVSAGPDSLDRSLFFQNFLISKYMAHREYVRKSTWDFDPATMKGYKYVVTSGKIVLDMPEVTNNEFVTVERVWLCEGSLATSATLKDLCLSFALFKLLRRRLTGSRFDLDESDDIRTLVFVRRGLAGGDHERMYRVIEVELGFLFDCLYASDPSPEKNIVPETATFVAAVALSLSTLLSLPFVGYHDHHSNSNTNTGFITTGLDIWLARLVIVLFLILELFQYLSLFFADWHKVKMTCWYVRNPSWHGHPVVEMLLRLMSRVTLTSGYCCDSVGQYSLLDACFQNQTPSRPEMQLSRWTKVRSMVETSMVVRRQSLPVSVKRAIHELLGSEWLSYIMYGNRTLQKHDLVEDLDWATSWYARGGNGGAIGSVLIWHIATTVCDAQLLSKCTASGGGSSSVANSTAHEVATTLSRYCAYLLFQAPELVTDDVMRTSLLMDALQRRIKKYIQDYSIGTLEDMFKKLPEFEISDREKSLDEEAILEDGIKLSQQLQKEMQDDGLLWTVLADMWVELLLTVTPSGDVRGHVKSLATGGEFIAHLWALLTHGGLIDKPKKRHYAQDS